MARSGNLPLVGARAVLEGADQFLADMKRSGQAYDTLGQQSQQFARQATAAGAAATKMSTATGAIGVQAKKGSDSLGGLAKNAVLVGAGIAGVHTGLYALRGVLNSTIGGFVDFDAAMTESTAIMGDLSETMRDDLANAAREAAQVSTFSATQAAESFYFLASAGYDATQAIEALPPVLQFAQAGAFDLETATSLLVDSQAALGLTSKDAAKNQENLIFVSDRLVQANILANASTEQFAEALTNKAGAALKILNKDLDEGLAVLSAFASTGLKGAAAGEALDITLRDLQKAASKNKEEFASLGIEVFDASGNMRNVADIVADLESALAGMSDETLQATLRTLGFQDRSVKNIKTLLGMSDAIRQYEAGLKDAGGITDEVANKQLQSASAQFTLFRHELEDIGITIGSAVVPGLLAMARGASEVVGAFGALDGSTQALILALPVIAGGAYAATKATIALSNALRTFSTASLSAGAKAGLVGIAIGGLLVATDAVLQKTSGHGLLEHLFGNVAQAEAAADAAERFADILKGMGGNASVVEAATRQLAEAQNLLNDAYNDAKEVATRGPEHPFFGLTDTEARQVRSALEQVRNAFKQLDDATEGIDLNVINLFNELDPISRKVAEDTYGVANSYREYVAASAPIAGSTRDIIAAYDIYAQSASNIVTSTQPASRAIAEFSTYLLDAEGKAVSLADALAKVFGQMHAANPTLAVTAAKVILLDDAIADAERNLVEVDKATGGATKAFSGLEGTIKSGEAELRALDDQIEALDDEMRDLNQELKGQQDVLDGLNDELEDAKDHYEDLGKELDTEKDKLEDLTKQFDDAQDRLDTFLDTPLLEEKKFNDQAQKIDTEMTKLELRINKLKQQGPLEIEVKVKDKSGKGTHLETQLTPLGKEVEALEKQLDGLKLKSEQVDLEEELAIDPLQRQLDALTETAPLPFAAILKGAKDAKADMATLNGEITTQNGVIANVTGRMTEQQGVIDGINGRIATQRDVIDEVNGRIEIHRQRMDDLRETYDDLGRSLDDVKFKHQELLAAQETSTAPGVSAAQAYIDKLKEQRKALADNGEDIAENEQKLFDLGETLKPLLTEAGYGGFILAMQNAGSTSQEMLAKFDPVVGFLDSLTNHDIPGSIEKFEALKDTLSPAEFAALAEAVGPQVARALREGVTGPDFVAARDAYERLGVDFIHGIQRGIDLATPGLTGQVGDVVYDLERVAREKAKSDSPAKLFIPVGEDIMAGIAVGLDEGADLPKDSIARMIRDTSNTSFAPILIAGSIGGGDLGKTNGEIDGLTMALKAMNTQIDAQEKAYKDLGKVLDSQKDQLSELNEQLSDAAQRFSDFQNTPILEQQPFTKRLKEIDKEETRIKLAIAKLKRSGPLDFIDQFGRKRDTDAGRAVKELEAQLESLGNEAEQLRLEEKLAIDPLREQLEALTAVAPLPFAEILKGAVQAKADMERLSKEITVQEGVVSATEKAYEALRDTIDTLKESQSALNEQLQAAKEAWEAIRDAAEEAAQAQERASTPKERAPVDDDEEEPAAPSTGGSGSTGTPGANTPIPTTTPPTTVPTKPGEPPKPTIPLKPLPANANKSFVSLYAGEHTADLTAAKKTYAFTGTLEELLYSYGFKFPNRKLLTIDADGTHHWRGQLPGVGWSDLGYWPPYLAKGGDITQSGWAIMGEEGREAAYMPAGSRVLPAGLTQALAQMAGAQSAPYPSAPQSSSRTWTIDIHDNSFSGDEKQNAEAIIGLIRREFEDQANSSLAYGVR